MTPITSKHCVIKSKVLSTRGLEGCAFNNVTAQVIRDEKRNLFLHINETPIVLWFKEQFGIEQSEKQEKGIRR